MLIFYLLILRFCRYSYSDPVPSTTAEQTTPKEDEDLGETRRIIRGYEIFDTRPYMVYLRPSEMSSHVDSNWLCGGVIIDEQFILTSAACIEDIEHFYVVAGTHKWVSKYQTNDCILNGAMRAVWKCVPRTYRYDGDSFNNIRWMVNDIAVVMTEDKISLERKVKGCDFIPKKIAYNNMSLDWERPGIKGFIAGWGSYDQYTDAADIVSRTSVNSQVLMETETIIINKGICKQRWVQRYHSIIDWYMICGKQVPQKQISAVCDDEHVACRQLVFSEEADPRARRARRAGRAGSAGSAGSAGRAGSAGQAGRAGRAGSAGSAGSDGRAGGAGRAGRDPDDLLMESAAEVRKRQKARKFETRRGQRETEGYRVLGKTGFGGFCENDHGGPLVVGRGRSSLVVGIISAYRVMNHSKSCHGPFLYTSVYNNRHLIECAIYKGLDADCTTVLRDSSSVLEEEKLDWGDSPRPRTIYEDDEPVLRSNDTAAEITAAQETTVTLDISTPDAEDNFSEI